MILAFHSAVANSRLCREEPAPLSMAQHRPANFVLPPFPQSHFSAIHGFFSTLGDEAGSEGGRLGSCPLPHSSHLLFTQSCTLLNFSICRCSILGSPPSPSKRHQLGPTARRCSRPQRREVLALEGMEEQHRPASEPGMLGKSCSSFPVYCCV